MAKVTVTKDKDLNERIDVACGECKRQTKHVVLASVQLSGEEEIDPSHSFYWDDTYQIIQCGGCETVSF